MKNSLTKLADAIIDWAYDNGYVDQLATLATNTSSIRSIVLATSSAAAAQGFMKGSPSEFVIGISVVILTWAMNSFVAYARNKHAKQVQAAVGMPKSEQDSFIGKETVAAVKEKVEEPCEKSNP